MAERKPRSWPAITGTQSERSTEALRRLEDLTRLISDWVWEADDAGELVYVSERVIERLGMHPVQLIGRRLDQIGRFVGENGGEQAAPDLRRPFRDARFEAVGGDGKLRTFVLSGLPRFNDADGQFVGTNGIAKDITDVLRTERQNIRLADAIDVLHEYFALYDEFDRLVISNARFRESSRSFGGLAAPGGSFEDLLKSEVAANRYAGAEDNPDSWIERRLARRRSPSGPFEIEMTDGRFMMVDEQRITDGGTVTMANDITELKRAMAALSESATQHREFASNVAHRLRTPLAVLRASLDSLGSNDMVKSLKREVDGLARMVEQLLTLTRYEHMLVPADATADLREIAIAVIETLAPTAIKEGRGLDLEGVETPVHIHGDTGAIEHALRNLVENAIKYSSRGSSVRVILENEPPTVHVVNQGRSIPMEARARLFHRFARIDRRGAGAGLGLNIVKCIADSHRAEVSIGDVEGGGTDFTVTLPQFVMKQAASQGL